MKQLWTRGDALAKMDRLAHLCEASFEVIRAAREEIEKLAEETGYESAGRYTITQLQIRAITVTRPGGK